MGAGDSYQYTPLFIQILSTLILRGYLEDRNRAEQFLVESGIEYVIARPGVFYNGPEDPARTPRGTRSGDVTKWINRVDVARFLAEQVVGEEFLNQAVIVGY